MGIKGQPDLQVLLTPKLLLCPPCAMVQPMARKKAPATPRTGRPPKGGEATTYKVSVATQSATTALIKAAATLNAAGNKNSYIYAVKIA